MPSEGPTRPATEHLGQPSWIAPVQPVVPDHELLRRIGGGSYGDVWLSRSVVGTWRAVKVVFRDRFLDSRPYEREFKGIQKFEPLSRSNEGFVDILQIGRNDAQGYFYYVMELADDAAPIPGGTSSASPHPPPRSDPELSGTRVTRPSEAGASAVNPNTYVPKTLAKALLQRGRLPVNECLELGITLNLALAHLHNAGLIHRDIKPSNLIFVGGVPKLADIGLVIEFAEARSYVGTEGFIPPEGPNSPQADLYSLGKVLYEAGMGKDRKDFPEPLTQLVEAPDAPELLEFNAILLKACAANVKDRYQSAEEMNADLALLQSGGSVRRQRKLAGQLRFVQRAGALVTALAAMIAAGWLWQARQTHLVRELADEKTRLVGEKGKLAEENREQLVRLRIANGVRLLDADDYSGALLWFAEALPLVTNRTVEEIHRIRIQQLLQETPRLLAVVACSNTVRASAWSPDGKRFALSTSEETPEGRRHYIQLHDASTGRTVWNTLTGSSNYVCQLRFSHDGRTLMASTSRAQASAAFGQPSNNLAVVLDAESGREVYPRFSSNLAYAAFSRDDRWLALAETNSMIRVVSAQDGTPLVELKGHTDKIRMLSFTADGSLLVSASEDQTVRLWSLPSGNAVGKPLSHKQVVQRVVVSDDGQRVLTLTEPSGTNDAYLVQMWEARSGRRSGSPIRETNAVYALAFSPGAGDRFLLDGDEAGGDVRDSRSLERVYPPIQIRSASRCWDFSPDGTKLVVGSDDGLAYILNLETGEMLYPQFGHTGWLESVHFSADGKRLLTTSDDGTAKLWDLSVASEPGGRLLLPASIPTVAAEEFPATLSSDGRQLWVGTTEPRVRLIKVETLTETGDPMPVPGGDSVGRVEFDATGRQWAAAAGEIYALGRSRSVNLWRWEGNRVRHFELPHGSPVVDLRFTARGERLVTVSKDHVVRTWITGDGSLQGQVPLTGGYRRALLSDDARRVVLTFADGVGRLFDIETAKLIGQPFRHQREINAIRFSADGRRFATVSDDQTGRVWDAANGAPLTPAFKHGGGLGSVAWSPDGQLLLTAGNPPDARLWDTATGELMLSPLGIGVMNARTARWSLDGRFIATRSDHNIARVWDSATADAVTPLFKHDGHIRLAILAANNRLITLSDPNVLRAWDLKPTPLAPDIIAEYAKILSGRRLSAGGVLLPIPAKELAELSHSLRVRAPQLFE
jgi:WD40 repeat protein